MLVVETIGRIRREHFVKGKSIKRIARELKLSRNTVRKVLRSEVTSFEYAREVQPSPKLGPWQAELERLLAANEAKPARERLTLMRLFEELRGLGYRAAQPARRPAERDRGDAVRRYARGWREARGAATAEAYVPLCFAPGEAYQFDWSHEVVVLGGVTTTVKVAQMRLCHSRMLFVRAYPRESQEPPRSPDRGPFGHGAAGLLAAAGVRCPRPGVRVLSRDLHPGHLRQHEDGGGGGLSRQGAGVQPPLLADVQPLSGRADRVHAAGGPAAVC
jgi:hypothetical protein